MKTIHVLKLFYGGEGDCGEYVLGYFSSWEKALEHYYKELEAGEIQEYDTVEIVEVEIDTNKSVSWETIQRG